jgi:hypothetical protein
MASEPIRPLLDRRQPPLVAVVDANIFLKADWMKTILDAVQDGVLIAVWSPLIISEVNRLLTWHWLRKNGADVGEPARRRCSADFKKWYAKVAVHFHVVEDRPPLERMWTDAPRDPWDQPIWTAAVRTRMHLHTARIMVITENLKDGPPPNQDGMQLHDDVLYIHPKQAVRVIAVWTNLALTGNVPDEAELLTDLRGSPQPEPYISAQSFDVSPTLLRDILQILGDPSAHEAAEGEL